MDGLLVFVALIVLAIPVLIIVLLVGQSRLRRRVDALERLLQQRQERAAESSPWQAAISEETEPPEDAWAPQDAPQPEITAPLDAIETQPVPDTGDVVSEPAAPGAFVFRADRIAALANWLRDNWFYAVSALSLALAGIFLVQYGAEHGLLPPAARVAAALVFGTVLIVAGEVIRRRFGDGEDRSTAYLPSVFSGAGLVTLFGGVLAARLLYGLIGPETAFAGMGMVALAGLALGWYHGPLLAAIALVGAFSAPFVVGGSSDDPAWLYGYFGVVGLLGLGIDTVRRWAWISILSLVGAYATGVLLHMGDSATSAEFMLYLTVIGVAAIVIPVRRLVPDHAGPMVIAILWRGKGGAWPEFPTRLAFGAMAATAGFLSITRTSGAAEFWLGALLLGGLTLALVLWARRAPALSDVTLFPAAGLLWFVFMHGISYAAVFRDFAATYSETVEADYPLTVSLLLLMAGLISLAAAWRSFRDPAHPGIWAGAGALFAPAMAILIDVGWRPAEVIGAYPWALHAAALAGLMVVLAERFARVDGENRLRMSLAVLSALSCLAFAFVIILSSAALTVALAVTVIVAAALDRRFGLYPMTWFICAGVVTLGYRLVVDPGIGWALHLAALPDMLLAYGGTLAALVAGLWLLRGMERSLSRLMLDSAAWSTGGMLLSILFYRWLDGLADDRALDSHWSMGLNAAIWLGLSIAQLQRRSAGGRLQMVRSGLAGLFALIGVGALVAGLTDSNPLINPWTAPVLGPPVFNTLMVAYLVPAAVLALALWRRVGMSKNLKLLCIAMSVALALVWLGLTVRHFWQGADGMHLDKGITQPELYTYTLTLLIIGAGLFYQSLARGSDLMRKAGLAVIGLAVAKVFLIDISGLGGLIRVFSLLVLGLALAGLAWLNRWALIRQRPAESEPLDH